MEATETTPEGLEAAPSRQTPAARRVAVGALAVCIAALLLAVDATWEAGYLYAAVGMAVVALAMGELAALASRAGLEVSRSALVLGGEALFVLQWAGGAAPGTFPDPWFAGALVPALVLMGVLADRAVRARIPGALQSASATAAGLLYVPLLLGFLTALRLRWGVGGLLTVLAVCKAGSTAAYFVGRSLGRRPLAPTVSPRKTVAGAVGQVAGSVAAAYALGHSPWAVTEGAPAALFGALVAGAAILGDLAASLLKRQARIKDSGDLLPGMGGMLDMLDDVLFAAPVAYLFLVGQGLLS
ncbi:MAG: phosphatidate cytidylyltransferase [Planctomycetota bacterium]|jgi:phosphatidate cytidylyltransferase